jgi:hypothetical protein
LNDCSLTTCFNIDSKNSTVCSGNGKCISKDNCTCNSGWFSNDCSVISCFNIAANDPLVCSGNGTPNICVCNKGFFVNFQFVIQFRQIIQMFVHQKEIALLQIIVFVVKVIFSKNVK